MSIFPFIIFGDERDGGGESAFRDAFRAARPPKTTYFCYDVVVRSPTRVEFVAYDILDLCSGGKGEKSFACEVDVDPSLTKPFIDREIMELARLRRDAEIRRAEAVIIERHAAEIRAELGLNP